MNLNNYKQEKSDTKKIIKLLNLEPEIDTNSTLLKFLEISFTSLFIPCCKIVELNLTYGLLCILLITGSLAINISLLSPKRLMKNKVYSSQLLIPEILKIENSLENFKSDYQTLIKLGNKLKYYKIKREKQEITKKDYNSYIKKIENLENIK